MNRPLLFLILLSGAVKAQSFKSDSSFLADAKKNAVSVYNKSISEQSGLFNGKAYVEYQQQADENPYFVDEWIDGTIVYDGEQYEDVPLLYDLSKDMVITDHKYSTTKIQLTTEKIDQFTLDKHLFVQLKNQKIAIGFYELAYNGDSKVYIRRQKTLQSRTARNSIERYFLEKTSIYIKKEGVYYSVKSKGSVLKVFDDRKSELKKFIREHHLQFDSNRAKSIGQIAEFYDQLSHS